MNNMEEKDASLRAKREPQNHRTIDRVTRIVEEVVYNPGMTLGELVKVLEAPKSSVYGFIQGLLAKGWLYEERNRFYLGPAVYGLTLASGQIRAGFVTHADLAELHKASGLAVFLGVQAGDHLIYIAEAGTDYVEGFAARSNIRRPLLTTAGGKALIAEWTTSQRVSYLRRCGVKDEPSVDRFVGELKEIKRTGIATNRRDARFAIATTVHSQAGEPVAAVTLVGPVQEIEPRVDDLGRLLTSRVDEWAKRSLSAREAI